MLRLFAFRPLGNKCGRRLVSLFDTQTRRRRTFRSEKTMAVKQLSDKSFQAIPTLLILSGGKEIKRIVGAKPRSELRAEIEDHLPAGAGC